MSNSKKTKELNENESFLLKSNIIKLTNDLLQICYDELTTNESRNNDKTWHKRDKLNNLPRQISSIEQLNSHIFVFIFENVCNTELIGKIF
jgi:hypothetical protein